jgi:hypothetical protein
MRGFSFFYLLYFFLLFEVAAQRYHQKIFDSLGWDKSEYLSRSNRQISFAWNESGHMESLIYMYTATQDIKYLHTLVTCIGNVIDRRDDLREGIGLESTRDYRGVINATWANNYYNKIPREGAPYAHLVHSANITYAMIRFAALVRASPDLSQVTALTDGRYATMKFSDIANDLVIKTIQTLNSHEDQWVYSATVGWHYRERCDENTPISYACEVLPMNMHSFAGRTFVQLYLATKDPAYLERIYHIAAFIKKHTSENKELDAKKWRYWGVYSSPTQLPDDISHATYTARFPLECFQNNLSRNGQPLFTYKDMVQYANTFTQGIYQKTLFIYNGVDYLDQLWDFKTGQKLGTASGPSYDCIGWLPYAEIQPEIYQIILDNYTSKHYNGIVSSRKHHLTLALLAKYEKLFIPYAADHSWSKDTRWQAITSGNFDGDDAEELMVASAGHNSFYMIKNTDDAIIYLDSLKFLKSYNWAGVASGKFRGGDVDDFVAVSNHSDSTRNGLYLFGIEDGKYKKLDSITNWKERSNWVGVVGGDFIPGGRDEFIAVRKNELFIYNIDKIERKHTLDVPGNTTIKLIGQGNFDSDPYTELAVLMRSDSLNRIFIYDISNNKSNSGKLTFLVNYTDPDNGEWASFTNGDFNGDGIDELIIHSESGEIKIFSLCDPGLCLIETESFSLKQTEGMIMSSGSFGKEKGKDQIAMFRNSDGGIVFYDINGFKAPVLDSENPSPQPFRQNVVVTDNPFSPNEVIEYSEEPEVSLYPNPSTGIVNISGLKTEHERRAYGVYDKTGTEIHSGTFSNRNNSIDLTTQKNGLYFLKILSGNKLQVKKVVLEK